MENNPYTSPSSNLFGSTAVTAGSGVSEGAITQLKRTKPWVRFLAVMAWIAVAFMLLAAAMMLLGGAVAGEAIAKASPGMNGSMLMGLGVLYIVLAFLYIYPAIKLWKYGTFIGKLSASHSPEHLEGALDQQRSIWKFVGIMTILMILGYFVFIGIMMYFTFSRMGGQPMPTP